MRLADERPLTEAMCEVAELVMYLGIAPLNQYTGCWERQIDDVWWIACNGHREPYKCSNNVDVPPFNVYVEYNGWPFGIFDAFSGTLIEGTVANEDAFIAAVKAAKDKAGFEP